MARRLPSRTSLPGSLLRWPSLRVGLGLRVGICCVLACGVWVCVALVAGQQHGLVGESGSARAAEPATNPAGDAQGADSALSQGARIYRQQCAACHGEQGLGTPEHYPLALTGDRSVPQLAHYIGVAMPEGSPEDCQGEDARAVAQYIHEAFYSVDAQMRRSPAQLELSRLTVREYEQAVSDLLAGSERGPEVVSKRGLIAQYYANRRMVADKLVTRRDEAPIDFDFTDAPPEKDFDPEGYCIRWQGALLVPETGVYEFAIYCDNSFRFFVNDTETPLIDGAVRSGEDREFRANLWLLGGRAYPIRLEFFKGKEARSTIRMCWKPPHGEERPIEKHYLAPQSLPSTPLVQTYFPPDDSSRGHELGTSVSKSWHEAALQAAQDVAEVAVAQARRAASSGSGSRRRGGGRSGGSGGREDQASSNLADESRQLQAACERLVERAWRRPLSAEEKQLYVARHFAATNDPEAAMMRSLVFALVSPRFLYREVGVGQFDDYAAASWLSFALWDSLPDEPLLAAAAKGELRTREQLLAQARRMLDDPRARFKLRGFMHHWLGMGHFGDLQKDAERYPQFTSQTVDALRYSLDEMLDRILWSKESDWRQLMLSEQVPLNGQLAQLYGAELEPEAEFTMVKLAGQDRAGVLTHPLVMAGHAYAEVSSPIHRGVFLSRKALGRLLKPPPVAVAPLPVEPDSKQTTRERIAQQTSASACYSCHSVINPLGFSLEHFDAIGRYRQEENGQSVDVQGSYLARDGQQRQFEGARALAEFLVASDESQEAFIEQLFHFMMKQPLRAFDSYSSAELREKFVAGNYSVRELLAEMAVASVLALQDETPRERVSQRR